MADKEHRKNLAYGLGVVLVLVSFAIGTAMATSNDGNGVDVWVIAMGVAGGFFFEYGRRRR